MRTQKRIEEYKHVCVCIYIWVEARNYRCDIIFLLWSTWLLRLEVSQAPFQEGVHSKMLREQTVLVCFPFSLVLPWDVHACSLIYWFFFLSGFFCRITLRSFCFLSPYFEQSIKNPTLKDKQSVNFGEFKTIVFPINAILFKQLEKMWNFLHYFFMRNMFEKKNWIKALPLQVSSLPEVQGASTSFDT